jgi:5'(3')-deoxyribonucleotidase
MKVFLDVDGVLADFRQGVCNALDRPTAETTKKWLFWEDWHGVTFEMVNNICTHDFWANLPRTKDGFDIFNAVLCKFGKKQIYFLTTPMPSVESYSGKLEWLSKYYPGFEKRTIITPASKSLFATPDRLLIDDNGDNTADFYAAGGKIILVPRMWNSLHTESDNTLNYVLEELEEI